MQSAELSAFQRFIRNLQLRFRHSYYCPLCRNYFWHEKCEHKDRIPTLDCPHCGAIERHRWLWLYLRRYTDLFSRRLDVLHISPAKPLEKRLRTLKNINYKTSQLGTKHADFHIDLTSDDLPEARFDAIFCIHVLEHIVDDSAAIRAVFQMLRPGGWTIFMVPQKGEITQEDKSIVSPEDRIRLYGQPDHVRRYGTDIADRFKNAGFNVRVTEAVEALGPEGVYRHNLFYRQRIYYCHRPVSI